jgi:hypothetical protein
VPGRGDRINNPEVNPEASRENDTNICYVMTYVGRLAAAKK